MSPSAVLQDLHDTAPENQATVGWVLHRLEAQSFGLILVLLAIVAMVPGVCSLAGLLLAVCAAQMMIGRSMPLFPRWITEHALPSRQLDAVVPRLVAMLQIAEKAVHPRWGKPPEMTGRVDGFIVLLLAILLLLIPVPFSNVVPAVTIGVIALAYLEEDGLLLCLGLLAGLALIGVDTLVVADLVRTKLLPS